MAVLAPSIGAPVAATPHLSHAALATLGMGPTRCWTADPRAVKLLASCAALPPVMLEHRSRFGNSVDKWTAFAGYRVEALEAIRMEAGDRLLKAYHQQGPDAYEPFRDWCEQPNASDVVAAVLASSTEH
jgi:hypothetical protein